MRIPCLQSPFRTFAFTAFLFLIALEPAHAQSPYLYVSIPGGTTSQVVGFSVALDGTLTPIPGPPVSLSSESGFLTTDPADQFLFVLNATSSNISVLSINQTTGTLTEVPAPAPAPIAAPGSGGSTPSDPICMATFKGVSANYLYIAYRNSSTPPSAPYGGAIVAFQIGTTNQPLTPIAQTNVEATPVDIVTSPNGYLYAVLQPVNGGDQPSGVGVFSIDPSSGAVNLESSAGAIHFNEQSLAINPSATFLFDGWGLASGGIESTPIATDGSAIPASPSGAVSLEPPNSPPSAMLVDGSGQILYVQQGGQATAYVIDQSSGRLSSTGVGPPLTLKPGNVVADPVEPYLYTLQSSVIQVFAIADIATGALTPLGSSQLP